MTSGSAGIPAELPSNRQKFGAGPLETVHAFWLTGMSCDGCSISVTGAQDPSLEDLLIGRIPGLPPVVLHHPVLDFECGEEFLKPFYLAAAGKLGAPYVIILEGSAMDDTLLPPGATFSALGSHEDQRTLDGRPGISMMEWIDRMAPGAAAAIAIGTCATWGGIPAARGNVTGSMGLMDYLGRDWRSAFGLPVINIPGCAPVGDNFTEIVALILHFLQGTGPLPEFDDLGRPRWQFRDTVHNRCTRGGYYEEGKFAKKADDPECLVKVGCWGPVVQCNIVERGAVRGHGGCMKSGGVCIGCTMPGFPDKFAPFYKAPPGASVTGAAATVVGGTNAFLRNFTMEAMKRTARWDAAGAVPSGWALDREGEGVRMKLMHRFYELLQSFGSNAVDSGRQQPQPVDPHHSGQARRLANLAARNSGSK
ncbi:MAG: hydrogenase expression protein HypE [Deltaproteobacteria bacterium]|nr:hydrogenase expression protein HypE [Deltaproteobacteria bacterium]